MKVIRSLMMVLLKLAEMKSALMEHEINSAERETSKRLVDSRKVP